MGGSYTKISNDIKVMKKYQFFPKKKIKKIQFEKYHAIIEYDHNTYIYNTYIYNTYICVLYIYIYIYIYIYLMYLLVYEFLLTVSIWNHL